MKKKTKILLAMVVSVSLMLAAGFAWISWNVVEAFEGKKWRIPSLVYGRSLELYSGKSLSGKLLRQELQATGYKKVRVPKSPGEYAQTANKFVIYKRSFRFWDTTDDASKISLTLADGSIDRLISQGRPADLVRLEPVLLGGIYPHDFEDRKLIKLEDVPQNLIDALLATEDQGFYSHWGVSPTAIARAIYLNLKAQRYAQGASTITQQLVKNFFLTPERSLKRKMLEASYAIAVEAFYSKDEILETYLNEVYLGQSGSRAIHGFGLGAEFYFGKSLESLSLQESALLVAIVNGPSIFNPRRFPTRALKRRNLVLNLMLDVEKIDKESHSKAIKTKLGVTSTPRAQTLKYPAYLDLVKRHLARDYANEDLQQEGLQIFTAFDINIQRQGEKSIIKRKKAWGRTGKQLEAAAVVASLGGDIEAVIGGSTPGLPGFNRALDSKRPIGSLVKPAIALAAFRAGAGYHLTSSLSDEKITVTLDDGKTWSPKNYDLESHGDVPLYLALAHSYNQAFVRLGMDIGTESVAQTLFDLGIDDDIPTNPAMLLGSFGLSPLSVLQMFQTLASQGFMVKPRTVRYVTNRDGEIQKSYQIQLQESISKEYLHLIQYALQVVMYEGTGRGAYAYLPRDFSAAGKTGTSNNKRDSWFAGFTGDKVAVVWMGRDDNKPTPLTGSSGALPVWSEIMKTASLEPMDYRQLDGIEYLWVDETTGERSFEFCQEVRQMPFHPSSIPEAVAPCIKSTKPIVDWFKSLFGG
ncbi:MAG: penicillin-binding protein 1B [Pseudobacteriovorax sp.]|nr:penicillin-binding protein 1B [Pseudobacteriovorax sp.]